MKKHHRQNLMADIIQQLKSKDRNTRIQAIKQLARSQDPNALKILAAYHKAEQDPELKQLALQAGRYLQKQTQTMPQIQTESAPEAEEVVEPTKVAVSQMNIQRAETLAHQAMDLHVRKDDARALELLQKAFEFNPNLATDEYTVKLLEAVTKLPRTKALLAMRGSVEEGTKKQKTRAASSSNARSATLAMLIMVGAVIMLLGYMGMPWLDFSSVPIELSEQDRASLQQATVLFGLAVDTDDFTLGDTMNMLQELLGRVRELVPAGDPSAQVIFRMIDAFGGINITVSGLDTTLYIFNLRDLYDIMGIRQLVDVLRESMDDLGAEFARSFGISQSDLDLPELPSPVNSPLDYTLILFPVAGIFLIVIGVMLIAGGATKAEWSVALVLTIVGMIPAGWFFSNMVQTLSTGLDLSLLSQGGEMVFSGASFIGMGFWVSVAGLVTAVVCVLIGLVSPSGAPDEKPKRAA
jgi:hypothetical protein